jgi:hypothetical protein
MIITAKFASTCPCCSKPIAVGSKVNWSKGTKASHVSCGASSVASAPVASSTRRRARFTYCEGWGADNPHAPRHGHCAECAEMG